MSRPLNTQAESLGGLFGLLFFGHILVLLLWGIWRCVQIARRPTVNQWCARSLTYALAGWALGCLVNCSAFAFRPLSAEGLLVAAAIYLTTAVIFLLASFFAVLGLLELRKIRQHHFLAGELDFTEGRGLAIWALILSSVPLVGVMTIRLSP